MAITAAQVRAARALLGWSQDELVLVSKVSKRTLVRFEAGEAQTRHLAVNLICRALEEAGVQFIERNGGGPGVRLRSASE